MTLSVDCQGQILKKVVTQEWDAQLIWNERDVNQKDVRPTLLLWTVTLPMTLTHDFHGQILKKS